MMVDKWHKRYLKLAQEVASWSKDPSTKIGAVAIGEKGQVLAQGYNGFPRDVNDTPERYSNRELKYKYVVHAEQNLIYNATYNGVSLDGAVLYVVGLPICSECAKAIIQVGIRQVVMPDQEVPEHWSESWNFTQSLFRESGVEWIMIEI
tara:strand:+ start:449 stop:895 length:447 start_codon:yes stop_codon:yes gene_type:complete